MNYWRRSTGHAGWRVGRSRSASPCPLFRYATMPTQSPARAFDALQVPFPVTNASRHAQPSFASPHAACPAPSLANYSPPAPTADTHGWMGPPTSLPASRAKIINKKFDRLLDKSPVPRVCQIARSPASAYTNADHVAEHSPSV